MEYLEKKMSPEVLIYIQTVKQFLTVNETTRKYFAVDRNEEAFFDYVSELSSKNYEEHGSPQLSIEQFELLRKRMHGESDSEHKVSIGLFINMNEFGMISLN
jgi:hypothetical protein